MFFNFIIRSYFVFSCLVIFLWFENMRRRNFIYRTIRAFSCPHLTLVTFHMRVQLPVLYSLTLYNLIFFVDNNSDLKVVIYSAKLHLFLAFIRYRISSWKLLRLFISTTRYLKLSNFSKR